MKKRWIKGSLFLLLVALFVYGEEEKAFNGLNLNLGNLSLLSDAVTRSISPENRTGEKGKAGMATTGSSVAD